jgi:hypothetical protein
MAYSIYFLKMQLLSEQFEMSDLEAAKVKSMATFVALFHSKAFLQSRLSSIAPSVDLKYLQHMELYKKENAKAAQVAINSIQNHLWYLTEEIVVLSIFDEDLPPTLRKSLVVKLLLIPRASHFEPSKPKFPTINPETIEYPDQLLSFLGPNSWLFFHLLNAKDEILDWMKFPVDCWGEATGYDKLKNIARRLEVVNDCAERGVKLISDFKDSVTNTEEQHYLFQVIEQHRVHFKGYDKTSVQNM